MSFRRVDLPAVGRSKGERMRASYVKRQCGQNPQSQGGLEACEQAYPRCVQVRGGIGQLACTVGSNKGDARVAIHAELQVPVQAVFVLPRVGKADLGDENAERTSGSDQRAAAAAGDLLAQ